MTAGVPVTFRKQCPSSEEMMESAAQYFNRVAFLFVPNICNAKCEFCYVAPLFRESARLPTGVMRRSDALAFSLRSWGFNEVRITGGEPLVFGNITKLIEIFLNRGLEYRLLTNGLNLSTFTNFLTRRPPAQITVSVHDLDRLEAVFRVPVDVDDILNAIELMSRTTLIECTLVIEEDGWAGVDKTLSRLLQAGVSRIKFILANVPEATVRRSEFTDLVRIAREKYGSLFLSMRSSDLAHTSCRLVEKGFLSIDLASLRTYACCVQVGDSAEIVGDYCRNLDAIEDLNGTGDKAKILAIAESAKNASGLPCSAHYGACPIALNG